VDKGKQTQYQQEAQTTEDRTMSNAILILQAKALAKERYNDGLDFFVECYSDEEWVEYIEDRQLKNWRELKACMLQHAETRREYAEEIDAMCEW